MSPVSYNPPPGWGYASNPEIDTPPPLPGRTPINSLQDAPPSLPPKVPVNSYHNGPGLPPRIPITQPDSNFGISGASSWNHDQNPSSLYHSQYEDYAPPFSPDTNQGSFSINSDYGYIPNPNAIEQPQQQPVVHSQPQLSYDHSKSHSIGQLDNGMSSLHISQHNTPIPDNALISYPEPLNRYSSSYDQQNYGSSSTSTWAYDHNNQTSESLIQAPKPNYSYDQNFKYQDTSSYAQSVHSAPSPQPASYQYNNKYSQDQSSHTYSSTYNYSSNQQNDSFHYQKESLNGQFQNDQPSAESNYSTQSQLTNPTPPLEFNNSSQQYSQHNKASQGPDFNTNIFSNPDDFTSTHQSNAQAGSSQENQYQYQYPTQSDSQATPTYQSSTPSQGDWQYQAQNVSNPSNNGYKSHSPAPMIENSSYQSQTQPLPTPEEVSFRPQYHTQTHQTPAPQSFYTQPQAQGPKQQAVQNQSQASVFQQPTEQNAYTQAQVSQQSVASSQSQTSTGQNVHPQFQPQVSGPYDSSNESQAKAPQQLTPHDSPAQQPVLQNQQQAPGDQSTYTQSWNFQQPVTSSQPQSQSPQHSTLQGQVQTPAPPTSFPPAQSQTPVSQQSVTQNQLQASTEQTTYGQSQAHASEHSIAPSQSQHQASQEPTLQSQFQTSASQVSFSQAQPQTQAPQTSFPPAQPQTPAPQDPIIQNQPKEPAPQAPTIQPVQSQSQAQLARYSIELNQPQTQAPIIPSAQTLQSSVSSSSQNDSPGIDSESSDSQDKTSSLHVQTNTNVSSNDSLDHNPESASSASLVSPTSTLEAASPVDQYTSSTPSLNSVQQQQQVSSPVLPRTSQSSISSESSQVQRDTRRKSSVKRVPVQKNNNNNFSEPSPLNIPTDVHIPINKQHAQKEVEKMAADAFNELRPFQGLITYDRLCSVFYDKGRPFTPWFRRYLIHGFASYFDLPEENPESTRNDIAKMNFKEFEKLYSFLIYWSDIFNDLSNEEHGITYSQFYTFILNDKMKIFPNTPSAQALRSLLLKPNTATAAPRVISDILFRKYAIRASELYSNCEDSKHKRNPENPNEFLLSYEGFVFIFLIINDIYMHIEKYRLDKSVQKNPEEFRIKEEDLFKILPQLSKKFKK